MRTRVCATDHLFVRLQTDCERLRLFREQCAKAVFVFLSVMRELPVLERPERERQTRALPNTLS